MEGKEMEKITVSDFRKQVRARWPHVKVSIRKVGFGDLARGDGKCLTVTGDKPGEIAEINALAKAAGIVPDGNIRFAATIMCVNCKSEKPPVRTGGSMVCPDCFWPAGKPGPDAPLCSICRRRHGEEIQHECE